MVRSNACPTCRAPLEQPLAARTGTGTLLLDGDYCPECGGPTSGSTQRAPSPKLRSPRANASSFATFKPSDSHLVAEKHDLPARTRILARLVDALGRGLMDPELLYLGGRYAVSLGLSDLACRFLDPLSNLLHRDGRPVPAFFPVGLLYLRVFTDGARRDSVLSELRLLAETSPRLAQVLDTVHPAAQEHALAGSPARWLNHIERHLIADLMREVAPAVPAGAATPQAVAAFNQQAGAAYDRGDLPTARQCLEAALLMDGDQPLALRNLVTITSEQHDTSAYRRYWRRFVKSCLWRVLRHDDPWSAQDDLLHFYTRVATVTDRELGDTTQKVAEKLRTPGLLPAWLEAHGALCWLSVQHRAYPCELVGLSPGQSKQNGSGNLASMRFWFRVFYPEFLPFLELNENILHSLPATERFRGHYPPARRKSRLPFVPTERIVERFAQWSKAAFGLSKDNPSHNDTVCALTGFVARLHLRPYALTLQRIFATDEVNPQPLRKSFQEACSMPHNAAVHRLLSPKGGKETPPDWQGFITRFGDPELQDSLSAEIRIYLAYAYCECDQPENGLRVACHTLPDLDSKDLQEDSQFASLWKGVIRANLRAIENDSPQRADKVRALKERLDTIQVTGPQAKLRDECLQDLLLQEQIERVIRETQDLAKQRNWSAARSLVQQLPDSPSDVLKLKQDLLEQLGEAEQHSKLQASIDKSIERWQQCMQRGDFVAARQIVDSLPAEVSDVKAQLREHIAKGESEERQVTTENGEILTRLSRRQIDWSTITRIAADNDLDPHNPFALNSLLKAIERQM